MPLDNKWTDSANGPFRDNTLGEITALTMRTFASELVVDAVPADWFQFDTGDIDETLYDFSVNGTTVDVAFNAQGGGAVLTGSSNWTHSLTEPFFTKYDDALNNPYFLYVSFYGQDGLSCDLSLSNVSSDVRVMPTVTFSDVDTFDSGNEEVRTAGKSGTYTGSNTIDLTGTQLLTFPSGLDRIKLGLRLIPPDGSTPIQSGGTPSLGESNIRVLVVARPASGVV